MQHSDLPMLERIAGPADLKGLSDPELIQLAHELRSEVVSAVSETGDLTLCLPGILQLLSTGRLFLCVLLI